MAGALSYNLHKLTARLDRAADGLLRQHEQVSYSRFLALFAIRESGGTQRELARWLGQTEPAASRMVALLAEDELVTVSRKVGAGNRRRLQLTDAGAAVVTRCTRLLEGRFEDMVRRSGVPYATYQRYTERLLLHLDGEAPASSPRRRP